MVQAEAEAEAGKFTKIQLSWKKVRLQFPSLAATVVGLVLVASCAGRSALDKPVTAAGDRQKRFAHELISYRKFVLRARILSLCAKKLLDQNEMTSDLFYCNHKMFTGLRKPTRPPPPPPKQTRNVDSDYIKISECHSGPPSKPIVKARVSTSFSSTSRPPNSAHQKSRSLNLASSYLDLDLPPSSNNQAQPSSSVYTDVDFLKTNALNQCKVERGKRDPVEL